MNNYWKLSEPQTKQGPRPGTLPFVLSMWLACAPTPAVAADSARFVESSKDQVNCAMDPDLGEISCVNFTPGTFVMHAVFFTDGSVSNLDLASVTNVDISAGDWFFSDAPVSDVPGTKKGLLPGVTLGSQVAPPQKLTFPLTHEVTDNNDNVFTVRHGTVRLRNVLNKGLVLDVSTKTGTSRLGELQGFNFENPILADMYEGQDTGPVTNTVTVAIELDAADASYATSVDLLATGKVKTSTKTAQDQTDYTLTKVKLSGRSP